MLANTEIPHDARRAPRRLHGRAELPDGFGDLAAIDVRRVDLLRGQLWTIGMRRGATGSFQLASIAVEHDGRGAFIARGLLSGPLPGPEAFAAFTPAGADLDESEATVAEAAETLTAAAARNRELGFAVPFDLAVALPLIAGALAVDPAALASLPVAPRGEALWVEPDDTEAFSRVAGRVLDDFVDWGTADGRPHIHLIDRSGWRVGAAMLDYAFHANDGALGRWTLLDLAEFFLHWVPQEETFTHAEMRDAPDAAKELLVYLARTGQLTDDTGLDALLERCDTIRPDFEETYSDRSNRGLAQALIMQMREEGLDPTDPQALQAFMDDFNSRPYEERDAILGPPIDMRPNFGRPAPPNPPRGQPKNKRRSPKAARKRNRR